MTIDLAQQRASLELSGERAGDGLGAALAIGDVNGDGKNDLIIGAPTADADPNRPDSGKVYVVYGPLANGSESISQLARVTLLGAARDDRFGAALAIGAFHSKSGPLDLFHRCAACGCHAGWGWPNGSVMRAQSTATLAAVT